ncbi:hypothetical protein FHS95_002829 [Sphingomonas naasensis]|uniref:Uncharacterized protein n=1 Tax=Sphingomonas naasensis TaxID=1344951 RepID=A0A4S1W6N5_9SPHN|nr:hypothetical protein [Sphingomonas naasensis]NIJ21126.1 hypothetical protein [Sphingomonas naasensis]TGX38288.1 hypothetical protein E5A74_18890 [Sphingomonas naasensis]
MWKLVVLVLALGTSNVGIPQAGPFDQPEPQVFARSEDQERARMLSEPCSEADIGIGCYRFNGRSIREAPCTYHIDPGVIGSLPTDQCYKMDAPRRYRGVWVDEFEGQRFIPEGTSPAEWPRADPKSAGWREQFERARLATIWLDASRVSFDKMPRKRGTKKIIEFVGRKTKYPGAYGHFGMSGQEIIVDQVIALRECPSTGLCR